MERPLLGREKREQRFLARLVGVGGLVQDRVQPKILPLGERVVLMIVALCARHRGAHPRAHRRVDPVHDGCHAKLLVYRAPFRVGEGIAMKGCCNPVVITRVGQ